MIEIIILLLNGGKGYLKKNKSVSIAIIILTCGIILSSLWLGYSMQKSAKLITQNTTINMNILTMSEVANYIGMSEEEIHIIISIEKSKLEEGGGFWGMRLPYFIVNEKEYFYKEQIDEWLKEASNEHREYDTNKGLQFR